MAAIHEAAFSGGEVWSIAVIAAQLGLPGVFGLVDESGGMVLARAAGGEAEILTLAVHPEARRRGIGVALLRAVAAASAERGAARLILEVSAANAAALALYAKAGFQHIGLRRRYYADGTDALILALDLSCSACM